MAIRPVLRMGDERLLTPSAPVKKFNTKDLRELIQVVARGDGTVQRYDDGYSKFLTRRVVVRPTAPEPVKAPPPDRPVPAKILTVLGTAPDTFATGIVVDAVTGLVLFAYIYPVRLVTVMLLKASLVPPSIFCQIDPLNTAQSPTPHKVSPSRFVEPATETR